MTLKILRIGLRPDQAQRLIDAGFSVTMRKGPYNYDNVEYDVCFKGEVSEIIGFSADADGVPRTMELEVRLPAKSSDKIGVDRPVWRIRWKPPYLDKPARLINFMKRNGDGS
jgi:hypothetical protein